MHIVAVMGSPHKGNSLELTKRIEERLKSYGDVTFTYLHLSDIDLKPCRGCFTCFLKGEEHCPIADSKEDISRELDSAHGVIFVSPVYSMHVTYLMKNFIDRFAYVFHRPRFVGKYSLALGTAGSIGLKETLKYLKDVALGWGFDHVDNYGVTALPRGMSMPLLIQEEDRSAKVADTFYRAIKTKRPARLTLGDNIGFRMMRTVYSRMEQYSPTDYRFWKEKGWLELGVRYFSENVRINPIKDACAQLLAWFTGRQMDKALSKTTST